MMEGDRKEEEEWVGSRLFESPDFSDSKSETEGPM